MNDFHRRWRRVRPLALLSIAFLVLKLFYFATIAQGEPAEIHDEPEGLSISFSVDQAALLILEQCVDGRWEVLGEAGEIRVNGKNWEAPASGQFRHCNQENPTPTLEVRLPSTAIAFYKLDLPVVFGDGLHIAFAILIAFCGLYLAGVTDWSHRYQLTLVGATHGGAVLLLKLTTNLSIEHSHSWGRSLHTLPMADLKHSLLESFLYLHNQPPLFTAFGLTLDLLFGASFAAAMYVTHVIFGILMCLMTYHVLWRLLQNKGAAVFVSLLLALNPSYFLYEALGLYTMFTAFLLMTAAFCLVLFRDQKLNRYLYIFILCINLLILVRSVYHIAILIPALGLILVLAERNGRRVLAGSLLICLLSFGWYGKNLLVNQSFSSSSWLG